jgi:hypothetical protein
VRHCASERLAGKHVAPHGGEQVPLGVALGLLDHRIERMFDGKSGAEQCRELTCDKRKRAGTETAPDECEASRWLRLLRRDLLDLDRQKTLLAQPGPRLAWTVRFEDAALYAAVGCEGFVAVASHKRRSRSRVMESGRPAHGAAKRVVEPNKQTEGHLFLPCPFRGDRPSARLAAFPKAIASIDRVGHVCCLTRASAPPRRESDEGTKSLLAAVGLRVLPRRLVAEGRSISPLALGTWWRS